MSILIVGNVRIRRAINKGLKTPKIRDVLFLKNLNWDMKKRGDGKWYGVVVYPFVK